MYVLAVRHRTPHSLTRPGWLTEEERQLCVSRLPTTDHTPVTLSTFRRSLKRTLTTWRFYLFSALFAVSATSFEKTGIYAEFQLWLRSTKRYTTQQVNYYPTLNTAVAIVSTYALTVYSDATNNRFVVNPIMYLSVVVSCIILLVWEVPTGAHFFAYIISGIGYAGQASNVGHVRISHFTPRARPLS
jgi:ACS family pantothenate transporter-like MFS transporter